MLQVVVVDLSEPPKDLFFWSHDGHTFGIYCNDRCPARFVLTGAGLPGMERLLPMRRSQSLASKPWLFLLLSLFVMGMLPGALFSQDDKEKKKGGKGDGEQPEEKQVEEKFTEAELAAIKALFSASQVEFTAKGRIRITYQYGLGYDPEKDEGLGKAEEDETLVEDWVPPMEKTRDRIRWVRSLDYARNGGIIIAEQGTWLHKAVWSDLKMSFEMRNFAQTKNPGYVAAAIFDLKGRKAVGSNLGLQFLSLNGFAITRAAPRTYKAPHVRRQYTYGFVMKEGEFTVTRKGKKTVGAKQRNLKRFRAGLRWKGRVQVCIHKIIFEGTLDDEWLLEVL